MTDLLDCALGTIGGVTVLPDLAKGGPAEEGTACEGVMSLDLPPTSILRCGPETARQVHDALTSVVAGHAQATTTYQFYEELDAWLGPWGARGYPIGYGKYYNVLFTTNEKLNANPTARQWVRRTTILLQEALRGYVVGRVRDCTIAKLTEKELREAAFASHPRAYDRGGLALVAMTAPELIPVIGAIPAAEFNPFAENFSPTVRQVFFTLARVLPEVVGSSLAALAGPAHTGILTRAMRRDRQRFLAEQALARELSTIETAIRRGELDHVPWLDRIMRLLNARQFPDQGFARFAREVVELAQERRRRLLRQYRRILEPSPEVRERVRRTYPGLFRP